MELALLIGLSIIGLCVFIGIIRIIVKPYNGIVDLFIDLFLIDLLGSLLGTILENIGDILD